MLALALKLQHALVVGVAAFFRTKTRNGERLPWVQQTIEPPVESVVEDPLDEQVLALLAPQSVAVPHEAAVPVDVEQSRFTVDYRPERLREIVLHPHVVVACKIMDFNTLRVQLLQAGEQREVALRHHVAVLEPIVENIAQQEQMLECSLLVLKQLHELLFSLLTGGIWWGAEMRVRHEQTVAVQHDGGGSGGRFFHAAKIRF